MSVSRCAELVGSCKWQCRRKQNGIARTGTDKMPVTGEAVVRKAMVIGINDQAMSIAGFDRPVSSIGVMEDILG